MNITEETKKQHKSKEYDAFFYAMIDKLGKATKFDLDSQMLYLGKDIKSDNQYLLSIMEGYKFWIAKSLF